MDNLMKPQVNTYARNLTVLIKDDFSTDLNCYVATIEIEDTYHNVLISKLVRGFNSAMENENTKLFRITIIEEAIMLVKQLNLTIDELNFVSLGDDSYYGKFVANAMLIAKDNKSMAQEWRIMPKTPSIKLLYIKVLVELENLELSTNSFAVVDDQHGGKIDLVSQEF